jgi:hypothetical protein
MKLQTIELPLNPENYYGHSISVNNLKVNDVIYLGNNKNATLHLVTDITWNESGWYEVLADPNIKMIAPPNTRVNLARDVVNAI